MSELVSILIPAYNAAPWIAETIRSALGQDWPRTEVIVVDDGSTDRTLEIARSFGHDPRVKVLTQPNAGASAARNRALSLAQGDYVQWLDADDLLAPDKIALQMRCAEAGRRSRVLLSSAFGEFFGPVGTANFVPTALWQDLQPVDFLLHRFQRNLWMCPAVWLVSRALCEAAGPWDEQLSLDDDGEYFARVAAASTGIRFVPDARSFYRRGNPGSLSRSASDRACESLLRSLGLCIGHLRGLEDSERTRGAGVTLLQNWIDNTDCFHPDRGDLLERAQVLARSLGGSVTPPRLKWKYVPIRALLGWKGVRRAKAAASNLRLRLHNKAARRSSSTATS